MDGIERPSSSERGAISDEALNRIIELVGDDPEVLLDLFETYLSESEGLVKSLYSSLESGDDHRLMIAAHSLKSTSATFGAEDLASLSAVLEHATIGELEGVDYVLQVEKIADEYSYVAVAVQAQTQQWRNSLEL